MSFLLCTCSKAGIDSGATELSDGHQMAVTSSASGSGVARGTGIVFGRVPIGVAGAVSDSKGMILHRMACNVHACK